MATIGSITQYGNGGYSTFGVKTTSYVGRASSDYRTYWTIPITYDSDKITGLDISTFIQVSNQGQPQTNTLCARIYTDESLAKTYSSTYIAESSSESTYINATGTTLNISFTGLNITSNIIYVSFVVTDATESGSKILQIKSPAATCTVQKTSHTITYTAGTNGIGSNQTQTTLHEAAITIKGAIFTRNGYTQTGWSTSDGGSKVYNLSQSFAEGYGFGGSITLYPVWTPNTLTVVYNANGGNQGSVDSAYNLPCTTTGTYENYNNGTLWNAIETFKLNKRGYHLDAEQEWNSNANGTGATLGDDTSYSATFIASSAGGNLSTGNATVIYYANWKPNIYTINYILNGGTTSHPTTETVTFNSSYTVMLSSELDKVGYKFLGWTTNSDGTPDGLNWTEWFGTWTGVAGDTSWGIDNNNTVTLYAIWEPLATIYTKTSSGFKAGIAHVKTPNGWKQGTQVYVKVDGVWKISTRG